ncbi:MAG: enoyl-CoA hydratase/isomerase family protein [Deltaproteobacteria bacterium]|nr:enoyl-CoA hydratase/isomerase family protein [Deltaproteobacteria bacterium]
MTLLVDKKDRIGYLTFNRPEVLNALDNETLQSLWNAWADFGDDPDIWAIVMTGSGERAFSVGRDLKKFKDGEGIPQIHEIFESFHNFTLAQAVKMFKPVIAAVNGYALGWGLTIALLGDIRIASENATFGFPEVTHGMPTAVGSLLLPRSISWCHSMQLLLTGETIDAQEAYRIGLVNKVVTKPALLSCAEETARKICGNAPLAVKATKRIARMGLEMPFEYARQSAELMRYILKQSEDVKEGPGAFAEKRKPVYKGR